MLTWLETIEQFPTIDSALNEPNGLLAAGGKLTPEWLLHAYRHGIFPWFSEDDPILWWSPNPRCTVKPAEVHISKSMRKLINSKVYTCTANQAFTEVIKTCADIREAEGTWILPEMIEAYRTLHHQGYAHSIEVWHEGELIGGLYGIQIGCVFFGESMFSRSSNASKLAFIKLANALNQCGFAIIDCQVGSPHLYTLGAKDIQRTAFNQQLKSCDSEPIQNPWALINSDIY